MPFTIVQGDIARQDVDAVVNAANERLQAGSGVCGAIFAGAGARDMRRACDRIGRCPCGEAVVTPGFGLPARVVVHAVGPVWRGGGHGERELLARAFRSALKAADDAGARSVALPLISTGVYGFPWREALQIATEQVRAFLDGLPEGLDMDVRLVILDRRRFSSALAGYDEVARRLEPHEPAPCMNLSASMAPDAMMISGSAEPRMAAAPLEAPAGLDERLENLDASFSQTVLALIDESGMTDAQVYKRANLSRQVFSKLRKDDGYRPTKQTAVALSLALGLDLEQTRDLLARAGWALGHASRFDVIVEYFIERGVHDVFAVNEMLFAFDQPLLGSM